MLLLDENGNNKNLLAWASAAYIHERNLVYTIHNSKLLLFSRELNYGLLCDLHAISLQDYLVHFRASDHFYDEQRNQERVACRLLTRTQHDAHKHIDLDIVYLDNL